MIAVTGPCSVNETAIPSDLTKEERFTQMVSAYQLSLKRMCYVYLRDPAAAEDAVQETFLKAYQRIDSFRGESTERTWLMSIAINTCRDMNRSAWLRHTDRRVTPEDLAIPSPSRGEDALALAEALRRLPARLREAVLLYYYQNMTIKEVSQALHAAPSTIDKRLKQAREKLRHLLAEDPIPGDLPAAERRDLR